MKKLLIVSLLCLLMAACLAQKPNNFTEETNPTNTNFELYSQKNNLPRRASLQNVRKYMAPAIQSSPVAYIPATSGNPSADWAKFVTGSDGNLYYIDADGDGKLVRSGTSLTASTVFGGDVTGPYNNLQINSGAVGASEIATGAVGTADLQDGGVAEVDLAVGAVTVDTFFLVGSTLYLSLYKDGQPAKTVDLSGLQPAEPAGQILYGTGTGTDSDTAFTKSSGTVQVSQPAASNSVGIRLKVNGSGNHYPLIVTNGPDTLSLKNNGNDWTWYVDDDLITNVRNYDLNATGAVNIAATSSPILVSGKSLQLLATDSVITSPAAIANSPTATTLLAIDPVSGRLLKRAASTLGGDGNGIYSGSDTVPDNTVAYIPRSTGFVIGDFPNFPNPTAATQSGFYYSPDWWGSWGMLDSKDNYYQQVLVSPYYGRANVIAGYSSGGTTAVGELIVNAYEDGGAAALRANKNNRIYAIGTSNTTGGDIFTYNSAPSDDNLARANFVIGSPGTSTFARGNGTAKAALQTAGSGWYFDWIKLNLSSFTDTTSSLLTFCNGRVTMPNGITGTVDVILSGSATLDFSSTAAQTTTDLTITVTGAADGDPVSLGVPNTSVVSGGNFTAWVSATNTVTVRFSNITAGALDPASGTFKVKVHK